MKQSMSIERTKMAESMLSDSLKQMRYPGGMLDSNTCFSHC
jgi:hypothetical protein